MRKHWIDNLRWVTVISVLIYHVFYFFNNKGAFGGIGGFVDDPKGQPQDVIMYVLYPWFMMLLFLVAGISARYALQKQTGKEFIKARTLKLLVPSTIGLLVFHWIVGYFNTRAANPFADMPFLIKWILWSVMGFGPLWFIQDLWLFSLLIVLVRRIDRNDCFYNKCANLSVPLIIIGCGILVYLGSQAMIRNPRPESLDGAVNLYKPLAYLIPFLLGYFVFSHDTVQDKVGSIHLPMLVLAIIAGIALIWNGWGQNPTSPQFLTGWLNCLYAWLMILAMLGCFKTWYDYTNSFCGYMSRSSFGIYIVHYSVIVVLGTILKESAQLAPWAIYLILTLAVLIFSPILNEIIRHIPILRWCVLGYSKPEMNIKD